MYNRNLNFEEKIILRTFYILGQLSKPFYFDVRLEKRNFCSFEVKINHYIFSVFYWGSVDINEGGRIILLTRKHEHGSFWVDVVYFLSEFLSSFSRSEGSQSTQEDVFFSTSTSHNVIWVQDCIQSIFLILKSKKILAMIILSKDPTL